MEAMWQKLSPKMRINFSGQFHAFAKTQLYEWLKSKIAKFSNTVLNVFGESKSCISMATILEFLLKYPV